MKSSASGTITRRPKATELPMRSSPCAWLWRTRTTWSASCVARTMSLHFS